MSKVTVQPIEPIEESRINVKSNSKLEEQKYIIKYEAEKINNIIDFFIK